MGLGYLQFAKFIVQLLVVEAPLSFGRIYAGLGSYLGFSRFADIGQ